MPLVYETKMYSGRKKEVAVSTPRHSNRSLAIFTAMVRYRMVSVTCAFM